MPLLILLIDKNPSFEVEVEHPVEGKPTIPITQFPRWQCFYLTFVCCFRADRMHVMLHSKRVFSPVGNRAPPLLHVR